MATKSFLCLVKLIMRMVLLKPTDNTDESEKALVGNTILVAQPSPGMIAAELPPTQAEQASYFNDVYEAGTLKHASGKLDKKNTNRAASCEQDRRAAKSRHGREPASFSIY